MKVNNWQGILSLLLLSLAALVATQSNNSDSKAIGQGELRQKYRLKYLTSHTNYPVRLKDHYGIKGNTRWFKHSCKCYVDEINLFSKFFTTERDDFESRTVTHLLILNHEPKSNFVIDHYEPRHVDSKERDNSNTLYDYEYSFETNLDGEIYTVLYLSEFAVTKLDGDSIIDNVNQAYADISCVVRLIMPTGIGDEHSAILNERIEHSMHLRLKLDEPEEEDLAKTGRSRQRNVAFKPVNGGSRLRRRSVDSNSTNKHTVNPIITHYEMEIIEGPIRVYRDNFRQGLNASCSLSLKDYDFTFAFNSDVSRHVFDPYIELDLGSNFAARSVNVYSNSFFIVISTALFMFIGLFY